MSNTCHDNARKINHISFKRSKQQQTMLSGGGGSGRGGVGVSSYDCMAESLGGENQANIGFSVAVEAINV